MTKSQYRLAALLFTLGLGLIVLGTTSNTDATMWGLSLHLRLAKTVGLLTLLSSLVILLVRYSASSEPTHHEVVGCVGRDSPRTTRAATQQHVSTAKEKYARRAEHEASRPLVSLARTSTEARLLLAAEKEKQADNHSVPVDDNHKKTHKTEPHT